MMMNYIWGSIIILSTVCAVFTGNISSLSNAVLSGANDAVSLVISILGMMAFWTGIMKIAEKSGLVNQIAKILKPVGKIIFSEIPDTKEGNDTIGDVTFNFCANALGLGNAATPMGIKAITKMQESNEKKLEQMQGKHII